MAKSRKAVKKQPAKAKEPAKTGLQVEYVRLSTLVDDPMNARAHDERNLSEIRKSVESCDVYQPLLVQRSTNKIIAGHGRRIVFTELGIDPAPVIFLDVDDAKAREIGLRDNRTAELAAWDGAKLQALVEHLQDEMALAPGDLGFSEDELDAIISGAGEDAAEAPAAGGDDGTPASEFKVLVICKDEAEQITLLEYLNAQGYESRALTS